MTPNPSPLDKLPGTQKIDPTSPLGQETGRTPGQAGQSFQSYMDRASTTQIPGAPGSTTPSSAASPFDLAAGGKSHTLATGPTMQSLSTQTTQAHTALGDIANSLNTPNLKLKQSQKYLLNNKLTSANAHLRSANAKLGLEPLPEKAEASSDGGPIGKFLSYVTDGQNQLEAAQQQLKSMNNTGESVNPAQLLLVQLKLNKAQQEIEYSSIMLSNAVSDIKMLFGIQL